MSTRLTKHERETIIGFNEAEATARIFTYNRRWQHHLEKRLRLKPTLDNGEGGKGYELDKKMIRLPLGPRKLSEATRKKFAERGKQLHATLQGHLL
jgi:hypothetical protein